KTNVFLILAFLVVRCSRPSTVIPPPQNTFESVFSQSFLLGLKWYLTAGNHNHIAVYYDLHITVPHTNMSILMIDTPLGPEDSKAAENQWCFDDDDFTSEFVIINLWLSFTACLLSHLSPLNLNWQFISEDDGSSYVVSGSGMVGDLSARHRNSVPPSWQLYSSPVNHTGGGLACFQVTECQMIVSFKQTDGKCVYQVELPKCTI
uniref:Uncharacterized protein n=1 Tax=Amphilophus citrinellus TaxID=61819 RepID=A0A3Q0SZT5_AMPCI